MRRTCDWCHGPMPVMARRHARFCTPSHRAMAHKKRVPAELRERDRWVRWAKIRRGAGHTKMPLTVSGRAASSTDAGTWARYSQVRSFTNKGFVLDGDGVVVIDLDHCLKDGKVTGRAAEILAALPPTYIEVSPSGDGLHVFGYGHLDSGRRLPGGVEVYGDKRFVTVTGSRFGSCTSLADLQAVVDQLV